MRDIVGEERVLLDDPAVGPERVPMPGIYGETDHGYGCWPALFVQQDH